VKQHLKYLSYVLRHKLYVFQECLKLGIPWRGIIHDLSKLDPREWRPYALSFYGPWPYKERPPWLVADFDNAWLRHIHRNPHHWQYWILHFDDGGATCLPMPSEYAREMLADWRGANKATHNTDDLSVWYQKQMAKGRIVLHPETREWIETQLGLKGA
jgi:Family of unknown function (DUF5662)